MAWNALKAFEQVASDPQSVVVVLVGSGHVAYGLGIERQARAYFMSRSRRSSGCPLPTSTGRSRSSARRMRTSSGARRARRDAAWPSLGLSTRAAEDGAGRSSTSRRTRLASKAGVAVGDLIIARIDKTPIDNRETLNRVIRLSRATCPRSPCDGRQSWDFQRRAAPATVTRRRSQRGGGSVPSILR